MKYFSFILTVFFFILSNTASSQVPAEANSIKGFSSEIDSVYTFKPSKLSRKEQETKLPALDRFWEKVKSDTSKYLPQLRFELDQSGHNSFFYYDGSELLMSLSEGKADKELAAYAISKCDLNDIDRKLYVSRVNKLAREGVNSTPAAVKILQDDKYSFFLVEHAMTFNQGYCLSYMLLPQVSSVYVDTLISIFPTASKTARFSIVTTLWFAYSCKGDEFLKVIMTDLKVEKEVREYAKKIMQSTKLTKDQEDYLKTAGKEHLDEIRSLSLRRFSDEAISDLDFTTRVMRSEKNCQ